MMTKKYTPPLAINFVWNPSDQNTVTPILNKVKKSFARDKDRPFSRSLNIPLFYFSSQNSYETPLNYPDPFAKNNIIFVFTSVNTLGRDSWQNYVEGLPKSHSTHIIPIAIDIEGLQHSGSLDNLHCILAYDWPSENRDLHALVSLAHEIYRFGFSLFDSNDEGNKSSISIFLSHAKIGDTGKLYSEQIKQFIDNTNMNRFFDTNDISPGFNFEQEIENHIKNSTLIAIESDAYSSRYWCQREILTAKEYDRPIIVVNCLYDFEDRIFPAASNVPCVHVSSDAVLSKKDILRILSTSIVETIRCHHSIKCLEAYRDTGWIENDCNLTARPPEIRQVLKLKGKKICYPEPPIYSNESDWHQLLEVDAFTPLWNSSNKNCLAQEKIGISISEVKEDGFFSNHIHSDHLVRLSQDLARHLLARSATLLYGGDLRPNGFTEFILDEAMILKARLGESKPHVENHLSWPLYVSDPEIVSWRAKYRQVMSTIEHDIPNDVIKNLDRNIFLVPNTPLNSYIWSRCLTEMRQQSVSFSTARICAGGKLSGYKGKMPGVLEEIILALNAKKPLFLLGAFGGVVGDVCKILLNNEIPETLTEEWQISHNENYSELQELARSHGQESNYEIIIESIQNIKLSDLSSYCHLDDDEYKHLMLSPCIDECVYLILKGIQGK